MALMKSWTLEFSRLFGSLNTSNWYLVAQKVDIIEFIYYLIVNDQILSSTVSDSLLMLPLVFPKSTAFLKVLLRPLKLAKLEPLSSENEQQTFWKVSLVRKLKKVQLKIWVYGDSLFKRTEPRGP